MPFLASFMLLLLYSSAKINICYAKVIANEKPKSFNFSLNFHGIVSNYYENKFLKNYNS